MTDKNHTGIWRNPYENKWYPLSPYDAEDRKKILEILRRTREAHDKEVLFHVFGMPITRRVFSWIFFAILLLISFLCLKYRDSHLRNVSEDSDGEIISRPWT